MSQTAYREGGRQAKQGLGSPPTAQECQTKVSALAPGVVSSEGSGQYQGSTSTLQTAKNRSERAAKTKGAGSEDPAN